MVSRLRIGIRQLRRALSVKDIQAGVVILSIGALTLGVFYLIFPALAPSIILQVISTFIAAIAGVYLSHTLIVQQVLKTDRDRIKPPRKICERYTETVDLIDTDYLKSLNENFHTQLPVSSTDSDIFTGHDPKFPTEESKSVYEFPPSISAFLEPRYDMLLSRFNNEGKNNRRLVRVDSLNNSHAEISESSYFRTYCTNLSPDFTGKTKSDSLRDVFDPQLINKNGLTPLRDSPFSNTLSGGGLVITSTGTTIIGLKSLDATVGEQEIADSFGGNIEYQGFNDKDLQEELKREAREEVEPVTEDNVQALYGLGIVRRLDWLGQPNAHSLLFIDAQEELIHSGDEHLHTISIDIDIDSPISENSLTNYNFACKMVAQILNECQTSSYTPGITLLTTLELWLRQTDPERENIT